MEKISSLHAGGTMQPLPDSSCNSVDVPPVRLPVHDACTDGDTPLTPAQREAGKLIWQYYARGTEKKLRQASQGLSALLSAHGKKLSAAGSDAPSIDTLQGGETLVLARAGMGRPGYDAWPYQPHDKSWQLHSVIFFANAPLNQAADEDIREYVFEGSLIELNSRRLAHTCSISQSITVASLPYLPGCELLHLQHTTGYVSPALGSYIEHLARQDSLWMLDKRLTRFIMLSALLEVGKRLRMANASYRGPRFNCNHVTKLIVEAAISIANAEGRLRSAVARELNARFGVDEATARKLMEEYPLTDPPLLAKALNGVGQASDQEAAVREVIVRHIAGRADGLACDIEKNAGIPVACKELEALLANQLEQHAGLITHFERTGRVLLAAGKPVTTRSRCC